MKIAVYGTLRMGCHNHSVYLEKAKFLGRTRIKGFDMWRDTWHTFPFVTRGKGRIVVEVYEVDKDTFNTLDRMEKEAGFVRREIEIKLNGERINATIWEGGERWTYRLKRGDKERIKKIEKGDWVEYEYNKKYKKG